MRIKALYITILITFHLKGLDTFSQEYKAVDLGLSVKWADRNLGAFRETEYGAYYAFGETNHKTTYNKKASVLSTQALKRITKKNIEGTEFDAAKQNAGDSWRMPTITEMTELLYKCDWEYDDENKGYKVTGPNRNSIFIPLAGQMTGTELKDQGNYAIYLSSSSQYSRSNRSNVLMLYTNGNRGIGHESIYTGATIRPVYVE